jgi:general secretion pathway protein H
LAIGNSKNRQPAGFTLIEVLLVIVIIGIMAAVGVGLVNSQSSERKLQQKAQQWQHMLTYLCQQAVLNNRAYGVELSQLSAQVMVFEQPEWRVLSQWSQTLPTENLSWQLDLAGRPIPLSPEFDALPHLVCYSDGQINPFRMQLQLTQQPNVAYQISAETPWQITGRWHE